MNTEENPENLHGKAGRVKKDFVFEWRKYKRDSNF